MGVPRSATIALAALFAGTLLPARAEPVRGEPGMPLRTAAVEPDAVAPSAAPAVPGAAESAKPTTPDEAVGVPAEGGPKAETPPASAPDSAAAPASPSDPRAAAIFNRLADTAPLLGRLTTKDREAIRAFYALGAFQPVWFSEGAYNPAAKAAVARLAAAGEDGLDARAYPVPKPPGSADDLAAIADADLKLSAAVALYARDARGGRVNLASISRLITPSLDLPTADSVLTAVVAAGPEAGSVLQRYNPRQPGYLALKARLAALRGPAEPSASGPSKPLKLAPGPMLKVGMRDPRVPALRQHLDIEARTPGTLDHGPGEPDLYDAHVAKAVSAFQRTRGLPATGNLNAQTVMALAGVETTRHASADEAALVVNMERWRWLPADLGPDYVLVNVPEYRLRVVRQGRVRDETRVIVGKTESPTPLFSGMMEYAVVNPSWYVPPSILKTMLPKIAAYGGKTWGGYEVVRRGGHVSLRQPPGEKNALGFVKFMFPNNHAVYLHDTPNRSLFGRNDRALSHGCVRVDDPFRFADAVLSEAWTSERLKKLIGKGERTIRLDEKLPVHLAYFTAYVDDSGSYRTLPDIYGYDAPMRAALGLPGGGGPAIARAPKAPSEPPRRTAEMPRPKPKVRHVARPTARAEAAPIYADPDPWAPRQAPVSRGWW